MRVNGSRWRAHTEVADFPPQVQHVVVLVGGDRGRLGKTGVGLAKWRDGGGQLVSGIERLTAGVRCGNIGNETHHQAGSVSGKRRRERRQHHEKPLPFHMPLLCHIS